MTSALLRATRSLGACAAAAGLAWALAAVPARAEIVGWIDDSGQVNYTNLAPPKGAKVVDRIEDDRPQPGPAARDDAVRDEQMRALNDRVRDLEDQLRQATRTPPPWQPPAYEPPPPAASPLSSNDCDSWFFDCTRWSPALAGPLFYYPAGYGYGYAGRPRHADHHDHDGGHGHHGRPGAPPPPPPRAFRAPAHGVAAPFRAAVSSGRR